MATILEKTAGLVAFVRTIDAGSFSNASRLIGASPSAVSKSVARLEKRLGVRLLQRTTRTLSLTAEGAAYYERVAPLLRAIEDAEDAVQADENAHGLLRVTVPVFLGRPIIAAWAEGFAPLYPGIKLELGLSDRHVDVIREGYDVAVRIGALQDTGLTGRSLGHMEMTLAAAPSYIGRRGAPASLDDLRSHACLRYLLDGRPYAYSFADGTSLVPDGPFDTDDGNTLRQAMLAGAGIAQLPRFAVAADFAAGRLVRVLPDIAMSRIPIHVLHAYNRQPPPRVRLFIDFLTTKIGGFDS